jgi:hypothetical protein
VEAQNKMTLKQIYIRALAENITAKQAGAKYNCNYVSLLTRGAENKLPPLKSEHLLNDQRNLDGMDLNSLLIYREKLSFYLEQVNHFINEKEQNIPIV